MKNIAIYTLLILAVLLAACSPVSPQPAVPTVAPTTATTVEKPTAQPATPAPIAPPAVSGPTVIVGEANSANFYFSPETYPEPTVALLDASNMIRKEPVFVSDKGQILGTFDTGMFPLPAKFSINLPIQPTATSIDLDNNGKADAGVQLFSLAIGSNLTGDSYLQQLEQTDAMSSLIFDVATGDITEGSILVYAPDDKQGFPTGYGADKKWFTGDDPAAPLPQGYSVARMGADGSVTLDRAAQATLNTVEAQEQASPDFSTQGILESFNSLIDTLKVRYAYTDLRQLDWEAIRAKYLPQVKEADAAKDVGAYYIVLNNLALSLRDVHVSASAGSNPAAAEAYSKWIGNIAAQLQGNVGAATMAASDPTDPARGPAARVIVKSVGDGTPAQKAGLVPGAEIVSVDGQPVAARYDAIPLLETTSTQEAAHVAQAGYMLNFPLSQTVTIGYKLTDTQQVKTAKLIAGSYAVGSLGDYIRSEEFSKAADFRQFSKYAIVHWGDFINDEQTKIAVLEEALKAQTRNPNPALILDLRGNLGGSVELYQIMASYFFTAGNPMPANAFDWYYYDAAAGTQIREYLPAYQLSAPKPELAYTGPLIVLVDNKCASACEYFSQQLQKLGRATVIGQYASEGAGGPVDEIKLPEGMTFNYTNGRTTFAGTNEFNLEAKGVIPDIRVPVTLESEKAKLRGEDPVLQTAVAELSRAENERIAQLTAQPWQWVSYTGADGEIKIETPANYTLTFSDPDTGEVAIKADCNNATGFYKAQGDIINLATKPLTPVACGEGSRSEQFLQLIGTARIAQYAIADGQLQMVLPDDSLLVFTAVAP
jgi:C-terminal processing protease CtpA/Prc